MKSSFFSLKELLDSAEKIFLVDEEIIRFLSPDSALERISLLLEGYFFKEQLQKVKAEIVEVKQDFPLAVEGKVKVEFITKAFEGYIEGLGLNLATIQVGGDEE